MSAAGEPIPPIAERTTEYAFLLSVKNGTNPFSGGEVTAVLPSYVTWLDRVSDGDEVTYNPANRTLKWTIGDLKANAYEEAWVQVAFTPSLSQVDQLPTLLETQRLRATDRFTGEAIRAEMRALTTSLADDPQGSSNDGRVKEN